MVVDGGDDDRRGSRHLEGDAARRRATASGRARAPIALLRSIRLRLLIPVAVATTGLIVMGTAYVLTTTHLAADAGRAGDMASLASAAVGFSQELEGESEARTATTDATTGSSTQLAAARGRSDVAAASLRQAGLRAGADAPQLRVLLGQVTKQFAALRADVAAAQAGFPGDSAGGTEANADAATASRYEDLQNSLVALVDAMPELLADPVLAAHARVTADAAAATVLAGRENELLSAALRRHRFASGEVVELATVVGEESQRLDQLSQYATQAQRDRYRTLVQVPSQPADALLQRSLAASTTAGPTAGPTSDSTASANPDPAAGPAASTAGATPDPAAGPAASLDVEPDAWSQAESATLRGLRTLVTELAQTLARTAREAQAGAGTRVLVAGVATGTLVLLSLGAGILLAIRTSRRLHALRVDAMTVARDELPATIAAIADADSLDAVRRVIREATTRSGPLAVDGPDEISEVGVALSALRRQALTLAAAQARLRLDVSALVTTLSHRGQTLVSRQLQLLDEFQRAETEPHVLDRFFALDHLAARMRRNQESILVLVGGEPGRRVLGPVALHDIVRAAAAEIEDYQRVEVSRVADVAIVASAVRDVIHLLAELLENAAVFSAPLRPVRVVARMRDGELTLRVLDEGIGIPSDELPALNARLAGDNALTAERAGTMGLLVVGRLAGRHGIHVELCADPGGGTAAVVRVPAALLTEAPGLLLQVEAAGASPSDPAPSSSLASPSDPAPSSSLASPADSSTPAVPALTPLPQRTRSGRHADNRPELGRSPAGVAPALSSVATSIAPDPDSVRTKLSGLSRGLTAAAHSAAGVHAAADIREDQDGA